MTLEQALRWIAIGGVFALPFIVLIVSSNLFFPYITGKNFAFRLIVELMASAWLALSLVSPAYRPRRSWILAAFALFIAVFAVADLQGVYPFKSIWSNFERMDGLVTFAHLFAYVVVAASVMTTEKLWKRLFQTSLAISGVLAIWGFFQVIGISALGQGGAAGLSARIDGTLGNPIYYAAYMLFHVFLAALLLARAWVEERGSARTVFAWTYGTAIVVDSLALALTGTRGTILGLVGGALVSALVLVVLARRSRNAWRAAVGTVVAIALLVGGFYAVRDQAWVKKIGFLDRLATISTSDNTVKARFINWQMAWKGVQERPALGWGQENYAVVFDKYYDPRMYAQEPWFDRVHNVIFDMLVAGGFMGLLSYLSIYAAALYGIWRRDAFLIAERALLTGLLAGYFFHNLFVFDNVTSYILFGTILAYIAWRSSEAADAKPMPQGEILKRFHMPAVAAAALVVFALTVWGVNSKAYAANKALLQAIAPQKAGVLKNLEYFETAIGYGAFGTQEAREQLAQAATSVAGMQNAPIDVKQRFYDAATREMQLQAQESPLSARFPLFLGSVYAAFGNTADAQTWYERAHELSPNKQAIYNELASNALNRDDQAGALAYLKTALELEPSNPAARILYAVVLVRTGDLARADEILQPIIETGRAADPRILDAYRAVNRLDKAALIWEARVRAVPSDIDSFYMLAAIYNTVGNRAKAIETLERAKAANPGAAAQVDSLIQQVRAGAVQSQ